MHANIHVNTVCTIVFHVIIIIIIIRYLYSAIMPRLQRRWGGYRVNIFSSSSSASFSCIPRAALPAKTGWQSPRRSCSSSLGRKSTWRWGNRSEDIWRSWTHSRRSGPAQHSAILLGGRIKATCIVRTTPGAVPKCGPCNQLTTTNTNSFYDYFSISKF